MILDVLPGRNAYSSLHPGFATAFEFLSLVLADPSQQTLGKRVLDGERLWVVIESAEGRTPEDSPLEFHRRYIDIQLVLEGVELIGWSPLEDANGDAADFDERRDIGFLTERPQNWLQLTPGQFAIFFPNDAHAPLAGTGPVLKAIAKVALNW